MYQLRRVLFLGVLNMLAAFITFGCLNDELSPEAAERQGFENFETAVARTDRNYDIYWMGREFEAGGLTYKGPDVADFGDEIKGGGLAMTYVAEVSSVRIALYSQAAWDRIVAMRDEQPQGNATVKSISWNGVSGELRTSYYQANEIASQSIMIQTGKTFVEITTGAVVPFTPSPVQPNPLIDEATFLAAMENLRPYPE